MKKIALMFPGQGSQTVGMGKRIYDAYPDVQSLYSHANDLLGKDLKNIMFTGSKEELTETENAQPALLLSSIAIQTILIKEEIQPLMAVGHSLGEYSALVATGAIALDEAIPLVAKRGKLMEEAYPKGQGTMAAVLGLTEEEIVGALENETNEVVEIANINCPGQIAISGTIKGIETAKNILKNKGAKRILPLNVSGPFHSKLMEPANKEFTKYLSGVKINDASIPVYANVTGEPITDKKEIKSLLIKQLYSPVRFEESINNILKEEIDALVEVGQGKVLSGLVRKIDRKVKTFSIQDPESLEDFLSWYKEDV